jgi:hypothetical protein
MTQIPYPTKYAAKRSQRKPRPADVLGLWIVGGVGIFAWAALMLWMAGNYIPAIRADCVPAALVIGLAFSAVGLTRELVYAIRSKKP